MNTPDDRLISVRAACTLTTLSRSTIWRAGKAGTFPKPVRLTRGRVAFSEREIAKWIEERLTDGKAAASNEREVP